MHRYLGIAVSPLMAMWCLSGIVMMYVAYPALSSAQRLAALPPLNLRHCCGPPDTATIQPDEPITGLQVEMRGSRPIAQLNMGERRALLDLSTGEAAADVSREDAVAVAQGFATSKHLPSKFAIATVQSDQWTVSEEFDDDRSLYKFSWADVDRSELYVSSSSAQAVQFTTAPTRFWNWLGAIPHWLYFTRLRQHAWLWTQLIIVTSLIGCFLTLTGLVIGVQQFFRRPAGRYSPYRGFMLWHHIPGLLFGVFALSWVLSGLLSMNPWGLLEGAGAAAERRLLQGDPPRWSTVRAALRSFVGHPSLNGAVRLSSASIDGRLFFVASFPDGRRVRLADDGAPAALSASELSVAVRLLGKDPAPPELLTEGDDFYFSPPGRPAAAPAYRVRLGDAGQTPLYLDAVSGDILSKVDAGARGYRWLHEALHRLDFSRVLRRRPVWDLVMVSLLLGTSLLVLTGLYAAVLRLTPRRP